MRVFQLLSPRFHFTDDHGTVVAVLDPRDLLKLTPTRSAARSRSRHERIAGWTAITLLILAVPITAASPFTASVLVLCSIISLVAWSVMNTPRTVKNRVRRICFESGVCPGCGYIIRGLPRADDGCTVCPECGAAWWLPQNEPDAEPEPHQR